MEFSRRTSALAKELGLTLDEVAEEIGISKASLYAGRKDPEKVSRKSWQKLMAAEDRAGLVPEPVVSVVERDGSHPGVATRVRESDMCEYDADCPQCATPKPPTVEDRLARLEQLMLEMQREMLALQRKIIEENENSG